MILSAKILTLLYIFLAFFGFVIFGSLQSYYNEFTFREAAFLVLVGMVTASLLVIDSLIFWGGK